MNWTETAPAVVADSVTKRFSIPHERRHTIKERVLHPFSRSRVQRLDALRDVSFAVPRGEFFGVVGRNGSGKSTLLKCLGGIYRVDAGRIFVNGRVSTFIELGVGFNPEMAARDNAVMNAVMLGLTPREANERFDEIIAFAELEDFVDLKLKNYSSGMQVRLAFAVMIQADADVLLIDEVLAVGDASFQRKCFDTFHRLKDEGKTIVLVTHDMSAIERFCDRALLLERGDPVLIDRPERVAERYLQLNFERGGPSDAFGGRTTRSGDGAARVVEAWIEDEHGARAELLPQGRQCTFKARIHFERAMQAPTFAVAFVSERLQNVFVAAAGGERSYEAGDTAELSVEFENVLAQGRYGLSTLVTHGTSQEEVADRYERIFGVTVTGEGAPSGGLVEPPYEARVTRVPAGSAVPR